MRSLMQHKSNQNQFQNERENTDKSLIAERAKATRSLNTANIKSQVQTDEIVKDERSIADQQTATSRADHDDNRDLKILGPTEFAANAQLVEERRLTDMATELERSRMDEVLLAERKSTSRLVAKVLENERIATDLSLLEERKTTDEECVDSLNLLKIEVAKHNKTQMTLTSRDEFLAIVSHDLKNPIGAIKGYADLILDGGDTKLGPVSRQFVDAIKRNAEISLRLISDLLDLERISHKKLTMNFKKCDAKEIVKSVIIAYMPLAIEKKITLISEVPDEMLELGCDPDRLFQVISNLIGNALKFTPIGGSVTASVKIGKTAFEFSVTDTGHGIPIEKQGEIFSRFAQIRTSDRTGLGLGLYIAKTIVEYHSGKLNVNSELGKGSTFHFSIPLGLQT